VELTMADDAMTAALLQLSAHAERLAVLDEREAGHFRAVGERLNELATLIAEIGGTLRDQAAILDGLERTGEQTAALAARLTGILPDTDSSDAGVYVPSPVPPWWKLAGEARGDALGKVRAWVEQVYRPGYGQLAATLAP
jgi:hypothetical protein